MTKNREINMGPLVVHTERHVVVVRDMIRGGFVCINSEVKDKPRVMRHTRTDCEQECIARAKREVWGDVIRNKSTMRL